MWRRRSAVGVSVGCLILLAAVCDAHRFLTRSAASQFLARRRRANTLFEESKKGNLERECIEELCNKEEAREIFENQPETEYFYPKYIGCLGQFRVGVDNAPTEHDGIQDLRACVTGISNQCIPLPCYQEGYERCDDGQGSFTCICRPGWRGILCNEDIDECTDPDFPAGCEQKCVNLPGSFHCMCEDGYTSWEKIHCKDVNECAIHPAICGLATCQNTLGMYECLCEPGFKYTSRSCQDIDECALGFCGGTCINTIGSFSCHCEGWKGLQLATDGRTCEKIPVCIELDDSKDAEILYLGEQFTGIPVIYLRYRLPENSKFTAEFDFRTFDPEGVILYAESSPEAWFLLGLRDGQLEVQFSKDKSFKSTRGGKEINDGQWHVISVEELDRSVSVKISRQAVMSITSPVNLFNPVNGKLDTKVYIAGLPNHTDNLMKPINPRLDGCIRGWNLMNQGGSGVKDVIQEKKSKHCLIEVERGSYFAGAGLAEFNLDYKEADSWKINLNMRIRPSKSTGVLFALVRNNTVHISISMVAQGLEESTLQVFLGDVSVAKLESVMLCYPGHLSVELAISRSKLEILANSSNIMYAQPEVLQNLLAALDPTMQEPISTFVGGVPEVPLTATPVTAFYHGCMELTVNGRKLDFDEAVSKHNSIKSHSCPRVSDY
ncbi:vitamin K-dependent protein S [Paramormyrops kingsleyae]|uniref:vitamin K-dependent protein S n=1 Tax=Paramormyrops kingsleyae TaxID=1676925 RepID=UPI003B972BA4